MDVEIPKTFYIKCVPGGGTYKTNVLEAIFNSGCTGGKKGATMSLSEPWNMTGKEVNLINGKKHTVPSVCDGVMRVDVHGELLDEQVEAVKKNWEILLG